VYAIAYCKRAVRVKWVRHAGNEADILHEIAMVGIVPYWQEAAFFTIYDDNERIS
jgi:hypothetical protein